MWDTEKNPHKQKTESFYKAFFVPTELEGTVLEELFLEDGMEENNLRFGEMTGAITLHFKKMFLL